MEKWKKWIEGRELKLFSLASVLVMVIAAFALETPSGLAKGMKLIVVSRDALITDYFELAGYGTALLNAALVCGIGIFLITVYQIPFTGLTMAALFINAGFGFWGKNPINILPILFGTMLYARVHKSRMSRYIYTALFGTCLAPLITELVFMLPFGRMMNLVAAVAVGIFIGFVLPPLSMHTASMHMGYSLFNVGFSAGVLAFAMVCVLRSFGMESDSVMIWKYGAEWEIAIGLYAYFILTLLLGIWMSGGKVKRLGRIMKHPGRAVTDFVLMDGIGATLMNMGILGIICETYILLVGGDLSGPVVGSILAVFGFAAFGVHARNYLPLLIGVYLSTFFTVYTPQSPGIQLAAIFAAGLAPIAGQFGVVAGVVAGFLNAVVVVCTKDMYGGLNLYNNGFGAGWVAIVMVPVAESFMKQFKERKREETDEA